ncbi:MAG: hypothetical protein ACNS60_08380 [Candidatus Cyclobacteriaceae bacterium M2_1C_046]
MSVKLEHFRNLVALASADGKIADIERVTLSKIAYQQGISLDRMNVMLKKANEYVYFVPQNQQDRERQLKDMIMLALVDGELAKAEKHLILMVGKKLKFTNDEIEKYVSSALKGSDVKVEK